jgi:hypothetical protein
MAPSAKVEALRALGSKCFWVATIGAAVLVNVIDHGWGSKADVGVGGTEFYAALTVDIAFGLASMGTGLIFVAALLWGIPGAQPAAVLVTLAIGQIAFTGLAWGLGWRDPAVRHVTRFYDWVSEETRGVGHIGSAFPSPLLR